MVILRIKIVGCVIIQQEPGPPQKSEVFCVMVVFFGKHDEIQPEVILWLHGISGRNWTSLPRCCFSHGRIWNRSMWKSRAWGGTLLRPICWHTSVMPQLRTPTWKNEKRKGWSSMWQHMTRLWQKKKAPAATNLEVALLLLQKEGSAGVACRMEGTLTEVSAGQTGSNMLCNLHAEITPLQLKASEYPEDPLEQRNLSVTYSSTVTSVGSVRVFIAFSTQPRLCRQKIKLQLDAPVISPSGPLCPWH